MLLAIDLFCGLGGWTEGFLAEGYMCYVWICHTKRPLSQKDSSDTLTKLLNAGYGPGASRASATVSSLSQKANLRRWRIEFRMRSLSVLFPMVCKFCTGATFRIASDQSIYSLALSPTICTIRSPRDDGNIRLAIRAVALIQTLCLPMSRSLRLWPSCVMAGGQ